jgi:uncharacterized protein
MPPRPVISLLEPNLILEGSVLTLTPSLIVQHGLKGLVFDVDDTIISTHSAVVPDEVKLWMTEVKQVARVALVSNNLSHNRIRRIAGVLDLPYIFGARKPSRKKVRQAVQKMDLAFNEVAMVGDRLFTDVLVGNRLGMFSVLVEPMRDFTKDSPRRRRKYSLRSFELWLSQVLAKIFKS